MGLSTELFHRVAVCQIHAQGRQTIQLNNPNVNDNDDDDDNNNLYNATHYANSYKGNFRR